MSEQGIIWRTWQDAADYQAGLIAMSRNLHINILDLHPGEERLVQAIILHQQQLRIRESIHRMFHDHEAE